MRGLIRIIESNLQNIEREYSTVQRHQSYKEIAKDTALLSSADEDIQALIRESKASGKSMLLSSKAIQRNIEKIRQILDLMQRQTEIYIMESEEKDAEIKSS